MPSLFPCKFQIFFPFHKSLFNHPFGHLDNLSGIQTRRRYQFLEGPFFLQKLLELLPDVVKPGAVRIHSFPTQANITATTSGCIHLTEIAQQELVSAKGL